MNFYEREIAKCERRIKRIESNPDPRYLKSNAEVYQIVLDHMSGELEAWDKGEPFVYNEGVDSLIMQSLGLHEINISPFGDRSVVQAEKYFEHARKAGVPDTACCRLQVGVGMCLSGEVPPPRFVTGRAGMCDIMMLSCQFLADYYNVPMYIIDIPAEHSYDSINHIATQNKEVIEAIERVIPGVKFDEEKLRKLQAYDIAIHEILREINQMKAAIPCPLSGKDVIRMPRTKWGEPEDNLKYVKKYRAELAEKVKKGRAGQGLTEEKLRFAWLVSAPFYYDVWTFLEKRGVSVPYFEFGRGAPSYLGVKGVPGDDREFGRHLEPLEEAGRMALANSWQGPTDVRLNDLIFASKSLKLDGLVHFMQSGCPSNVTNARMVGERIEKEMGIPSVHVNGWCLDQEKFNEQELTGALESFIDICMERKYGSNKSMAT